MSLKTLQQYPNSEVIGEFYSPGTSIATLEYITGYGRIFWDLPVETQYIPGVELDCHIVITNTTDKSRLYLVKAKAANNHAIIEGVVLINGEQWFVLEPGQTIELLGSLTFGMTDCLLGLDLYEKSTGEIVNNCMTYLYHQEVGASMLLQSMAAKNVASSITGTMTNMMTMMMITGMGVAMIKGAK